VEYLYLQSPATNAMAELKDTGGARGDQDFCPCPGNIIHLAIKNSHGLIVVGQTIGSGAAATPVGFGQFLEGDALYSLDKAARLSGDLGRTA